MKKEQIKNMKMSYTNYLGITKDIVLNDNQIEQLNKKFTYEDNVKRLSSACKSYTNNYWVTGYINNKEVCHYQCNQL